MSALSPDRSHHIGGSEVASLFESVLAQHGESPYVSMFELWHIKAGNIEPKELDNDRIKAGHYMEPGIAAWTQDKSGGQVKPFSNGYLSNGKGLGGTPDRILIAPGRETPGILEIKNVDRSEFMKWSNKKPPLKFQLQLQNYIGLAGYSWGCLAALVGGNDLTLYFYDFRPGVFAEIVKRTKAFWDSIVKNEQPDIFSASDVGLYLKTMKALGDDVADLSNDAELDALLAEYDALSQSVDSGEDRLKLIKKALADRLAAENARKAITSKGSISLVSVAASPGKQITQDMVGQMTGSRAGYSKIQVYFKKEKVA